MPTPDPTVDESHAQRDAERWIDEARSAQSAAPEHALSSSGSSGPNADSSNDTIPAGTRCIACKYLLEGCRQGPCPECGLTIGGDEIARWQGRVAWERGFAMRWVVAAAMVLPVVYAAAAMVYGGQHGPGLAALMATSLTLGGSFVTGELLAWLGDPLDRRLTRRVWINASAALQFPWLAIAPAAAVVLAVAFVERATGGDGITLLLVAMTGFFAWVFCSLSALFVCYRALNGVWQRHALRWNKPQITLMVLAVCLQFPANCFAGFVGGTLAAFGAADLAGLDLWTDF